MVLFLRLVWDLSTHHAQGKYLATCLTPKYYCSAFVLYRYNDDTLQSYFSIGLQGLHEDSIEKVEKIIISIFDKFSE